MATEIRNASNPVLHKNGTVATETHLPYWHHITEMSGTT